VAAKKSSFLESIERARAATQTAPRPDDVPLDRMSADQLNEALRAARVEAIEANRALAQAAAEEYTRPDTTLAARLAELQKSKRRTWR